MCFSYVANQEKDTYWFHPDHLGSSSFITGLDGEVTQNMEYFPSGEIFVENHNKDGLNSQYKFNGKEQDAETGYYYYGARYYNPRVSLWLNVDPLAEKYPSWSPYVYCGNNPINYIDPDGMDPLPAYMRTAAIRIAAAGLNSVGGGVVKGNSGAEKLMNGLMMNYAAKHNMTLRQWQICRMKLTNFTMV